MRFLKNQPIGTGKIIDYGKNPGYKGTLPFKPGTEVYIIEHSTLELLLQNALNLIKSKKISMPEVVFEEFPEEVDFSSDKEVKLFLDRHFYSHDLTKYVYVRYATMDQFDKEGDFYHPDFQVDIRKSTEDDIIYRDEHLPKPNTYFDGEEYYDTDDT